MTSLDFAKKGANLLKKKKAYDVKIINIEKISTIADFFVIANGTSSTHVKSLADELETNFKYEDKFPNHIEGYRSNSWILLDYGNVVFHIFSKEARDFYNLESLWKDGKVVSSSEEQVQ